MLSNDIKEILLGIKFREDVFTLLDELAADFPVSLLISPNKFQPDSRLNKPFGLKFQVTAKRLPEVKDKLTQLPEIYRVYHISEGEDQVDLVIIRPTDKYELLRIMGTNSETKHDLDTGTLLARLRRWEEEYGLELMGAGENWVKIEIGNTPERIREFAKEVMTFAPSTVTEGELARLEEAIRTEKVIVLRW
jgi:hypothetical protein